MNLCTTIGSMPRNKIIAASFRDSYWESDIFIRAGEKDAIHQAEGGWKGGSSLGRGNSMDQGQFLK